MTSRSDERLWRWTLALLVAAGALTAFAPALGNGFVDWDDGLYIVRNPAIYGLGLKNFYAMLTDFRGGLWQPLTWLSFALDHAVWGLEPCGYHLTNILIHAATALLFYGVCLRLFKLAAPSLADDDRAAGAALAALFFAVHPLRVESVAWATERKGLLAGFFCVAALAAHLKAARAPRRGARWEAAGLACFALSLSAKGMGMTFPVVLLILEIYPIGRLAADPRKWLKPPSRRVLVAPLYYLILAAAGALLNMAASIDQGTIKDIGSLGSAWRVGRILYGLCFYPSKTLWPAALAPLYPPRPWFGLWSWELFACAIAVAACAALLWRWRRSRPWLAAAFACCAVLVSPMLGFFQQGHLYAAGDRFSYLSCLGFAAIFGAAFARAPRAARVLALAWLAMLGAASWRQCAVWRDPVDFWAQTYERAPGELALANWAGSLIETGRGRDAVPLLERGLAAYPKFALNYLNLGVVRSDLGDQAGARVEWRRGLALSPTPDIEARLGLSLVQSPGRQFDEGAKLLEAAVLQNPGEASWRAELAEAYARGGLLDPADHEFAAAVSLDPHLGRAWNNWGLALARRGDAGGAMLRYRAALCDIRTRAQANHNMGNLLLDQGRLPEAERHFREALRIDPGLAEAQINLGNILARRGRYAEAAARYRIALKNDPSSTQARANLTAVARFLPR